MQAGTKWWWDSEHLKCLPLHLGGGGRKDGKSLKRPHSLQAPRGASHGITGKTLPQIKWTGPGIRYLSLGIFQHIIHQGMSTSHLEGSYFWVIQWFLSPPGLLPFLFFFLSWWKIALQCCAGFSHTAERIRHNYVCVAAFLSLHLARQYWFSRFHIYALPDDTCLSVSDLLCMGGFRFICVTTTDSDLFLFNG